jgi:integrase
MGEKLTDKIVRTLAVPDKGNRITYDTEVLGFGARVTAGGARAFILNYRVKATGLERRYTIGSFPDWSVSVAREEAKKLKRQVDSGGDPVGEVKASRDAPTVADLFTRFEEEHVSKLRPNSQQDYRDIIRKDIVPALGRMKVAAVDFEHVERMHRKITQRAPTLANRALAVTSTMFALAIKWRLRLDNPCKGVRRNREQARKRYLTPEELDRLTTALAAHPNQQLADIFRLLLLTGARRSEVLSAKWEQFDFQDKKAWWTKPATLTKQKAEHRIPLSAPAREILARLRRDDQPWLFPGRSGQHRINLDHSWRLICKAAGITGLRIHDLRHSYASQLASSGTGLHVIGALLGHTQPQTTHRYAHLYDDPLYAATERAGAILAGPKTTAGGKVTKFPARAEK